MRPAKIFEVFEDRKGKRTFLYTKNLVPGQVVYGEKLVRDKDSEYREWDPKRSKLCASILKGSPNVGIRKGDVVLYLGAASGTTASHVSDMVGKEGFVFALDFAPRVVRDLYFVCQQRKNMAPLLADARHPDSYVERVCLADVVYQDLAQKDQVQVFMKNVRQFLKEGGYALLAVKARSVDVTRKPREIFKEVQKELEKEMTVIDYRELSPFQMDHCMFVCKR
jgi:fibrillarin-like pre-rRNA processing protein